MTKDKLYDIAEDVFNKMLVDDNVHTKVALLFDSLAPKYMNDNVLSTLSKDDELFIYETIQMWAVELLNI